MSDADEASILMQYESMLAVATRRVEDAQRDRESLAVIVTAMRRRLSPSRGATGREVLPTYQGRVTLSGFIRALMVDGRRRTIDQVLETVATDDRFLDQVPSRNTLSNRMHELAKTGELRRVQRGVYELASGAVGMAEPGRMSCESQSVSEDETAELDTRL